MGKCVVIIGQERSGTTMLAEIVNALGIPFHPKWEDPRVANPLSIMPVDVLNFDFQSYTPVSGYPESLFATYMDERKNDTWGWKVPRFMFFWRDLVKHIPNPRFVVITRNPYAIALSEMKFVKRANDMSLDEALRIVNRRQAIINDFIKHNNCLIVQYENFISKTRDEIQKVADYIEMKNNNKAIDIPKLI